MRKTGRIGQGERGEVQSPIIEVERSDGARAGSGQTEQQRGVPDEHLEQQRNIANQLDIKAGEPRKQPVGRQARHADREAEQGREDDAERRYQKRVEKTHRQRRGIGIARRVSNQRFANRETRPVEQETEPRPDVSVREIVRQCRKQAVGDHKPARDQQPG